MSKHHSWNLLLLCCLCLMIPPLFLQSPVDKSFSFIAQTQGLQVHRPQKGGKGGDGGGDWRAGGPCEKENGQSGDKRGRNRAPHRHPGLTSTPSHPIPDPCLHPRPLPNPDHLSALLACRHHTWLENQLRVVPPGTTRPFGVCGRGRGPGVAGRPCGRSCWLFFWGSRGAVMRLSYSCARWCLPCSGPSTSFHLQPTALHWLHTLVLMESKEILLLSY